mgnify:CR=1 FL=1
MAGRVFNESARTSINGLADEVKRHQENFRQTATILQVHEVHIAQNGAMSQKMARFVNALIQEDAKKRMWIESLAMTNQESQRSSRNTRLASKSSPRRSRGSWLVNSNRCNPNRSMPPSDLDLL